MLRDFFKDYKWSNDVPLIIGMGPTFDQAKKHNLSLYNVIGLNRVAGLIPVDISHIIDFYIVDKLGEKLLTQAKALVMPYYPHYACRPSQSLPLSLAAEGHPIVSQFAKEGRLYAYNLSTIMKRIGDSPVIKARYLSAEAAFNLCAHSGWKKIYSLGIDGGTTRSSTFSDHGPTDPRGFDTQWAGIAKTIKRFDIDYMPIGGNYGEIMEKINAHQEETSVRHS